MCRQGLSCFPVCFLLPKARCSDEMETRSWRPTLSPADSPHHPAPQPPEPAPPGSRVQFSYRCASSAAAPRARLRRQDSPLAVVPARRLAGAASSDLVGQMRRDMTVMEATKRDTAKHRHHARLRCPALALGEAETGLAHIHPPTAASQPARSLRFGQRATGFRNPAHGLASEERHSSRKRPLQRVGVDYNWNKSLIASSKDTSSTASAFALSVSSWTLPAHQEKLTEYPQNRRNFGTI